MPSQFPESVRPSPALDTSYYARLCNLLLLPFNRQDAFRLGLIDTEGNVLKRPSNANEEAALTPFHELAFGIRKYILNTPGGSRLLSASSGLASLAKLHNKKFDAKEVGRLTEEFKNIHKLVLENNISYPVEELIIERFLLAEEAPANSTSAMTDHNGTIDPPLNLTRRKPPEEL